MRVPNANATEYLGTQIKQLEKSDLELLSKRKQFNWDTLLENTEVLFFGEDHKVAEIRNFIIEQLPILKKKYGISQIALEMLTSDLQIYLDEWNDQAKEKIKESLMKGWDRGLGLGESYFQLIEEAKKLGMRVIAMEDPNDEISYKSGNSRMIVNQYWSKILETNLSQGKIAVLCGLGHLTQSSDAVSSMMMEKKIPCNIIQFTGIQTENVIENNIKYADVTGIKMAQDDKIELIIRKIGLKERFMIQLELSGEVDKKFWLVNLYGNNEINERSETKKRPASSATKRLLEEKTRIENKHELGMPSVTSISVNRDLQQKHKGITDLLSAL